MAWRSTIHAMFSLVSRAVSDDYAGFFNGAFNTIRDESKGRSFIIPFFRDGMREDDDGPAHRVFAAPSASHLAPVPRHSGAAQRASQNRTPLTQARLTGILSDNHRPTVGL